MIAYFSFMVNYRLRPYTQEEGALDLARTVRFVRKNAEVYGIDENDIAVMGFSAGEMLLNFDGLVNGTALDDSYAPDALDKISADAANFLLLWNPGSVLRSVSRCILGGVNTFGYILHNKVRLLMRFRFVYNITIRRRKASSSCE